MDFIPQFEPWLGEEEKRLLCECIDDNWITGGKKVKEFERRVAELHGAQYAVACANGTGALFMALKAVGVGEGDEVIVPDFTFIASANAVKMAGGIPVFVDVERKSLNIDVEKAEKAITLRTKAIMPVHIYGRPADMGAVLTLADKHKLRVVEDAAQGVGVSWQGIPVGGIGDAGCLSFYGDKTLTCLPGDTRIVNKLFKQGRGGSMTVPIKDIKVGDYVVSYNEKTAEKSLDLVTRVMTNTADSLLAVRLSNHNELRITGNHPVYVVGKGWTVAEHLRVGDRVIQYQYRYLSNRIRNLQGRGKLLDERWGPDKVSRWRTTHRDKLVAAHQNPNSGYSGEGYKGRGKSIASALDQFFQSAQGLKQRESASAERKASWANPTSIYNTEHYRAVRLAASTAAQRRPEVRARKAQTTKQRWANPAYRSHMLDNMQRMRTTPAFLEAYSRGMAMKPNKAEHHLECLLKDVAPDFAYNGDYRLGISIGAYIPDFVNINGKKKVIELFGRHWHKEDEVATRIGRMRSLGWECLIIWEDELNQESAVKDKIQTYAHNPNVSIVEVTSIESVPCHEPVYNIETQNNHNYFAHGILVHNCGEGGMVLTDSREIANTCLRLSHQGNLSKGKYIHETIGFNFRLTDLQAAVGLAQLGKLDRIIEAKRRNETLYRGRLAGIPCIEFLEDGEDDTTVPFRVVILTDDPAGLSEHMARWGEGVGTNRVFYPLHKQPCYMEWNESKAFPNSVWAYEHGLALPSSAKLTEKQIRFVCEGIESFVGDR